MKYINKFLCLYLNIVKGNMTQQSGILKLVVINIT